MDQRSCPLSAGWNAGGPSVCDKVAAGAPAAGTAFAAGVPATWVTGDSVYGDNRDLRLWLEAQPQAYDLAVSRKAYVWRDGRQRQVKTLMAALPAEGSTRLSAGVGPTGPRWYDWRWLPLTDPPDPCDIRLVEL